MPIAQQLSRATGVSFVGRSGREGDGMAGQDRERVEERAKGPLIDE